METIELIRTYKAEQNGMYHYNLIVHGEPVKIHYSAHAFDFGLVNIADSGEINLELYKNTDSVDMIASGLIVPVTLN